MKRLAASLLALLLLATPAMSEDWIAVARKANRSLVALSYDGQNFCSGFVVDAQRDFIQTADHCVQAMVEEGGTMLADGRDVVIVARDQDHDLAVIHAETSKPALRPSARSIQPGMPALEVGYAYGYKVPQVRVSYVTGLNYDLSRYGFGGGFVGFDNPMIGGMSGGPVVDRDGNVISLNQVGDNLTGYGRPIGVILSSMGKYWRR